MQTFLLNPAHFHVTRKSEVDRTLFSSYRTTTFIKRYGPTVQLWVQYVEFVTLIRQFIEAERTGNWELHMNTIAKMIPFFDAAGHFNYAKSVQLCLQDMTNLKEVMTEEEYVKFTKDF